MGTNYYWYPSPPCKECGREYDPKHIGKSSGGWCFSLHVIPDENINDLLDWEKLWGIPRSEIKDEYGKIFSASEMLSIIKERKWGKRGSDNGNKWYLENHAEHGPNGLARSSIDGRHCIGHGEGTWDLVIGEFS